MDISFVTRKLQRSIAGIGLATMIAASTFTGTAFGLTFDDVDSDYFAADEIAALSDAGVMIGLSDGTFGVNQSLTRQEAAKVLVTAFGFTLETDAAVTCTGSYDAWAEDYLATANLYGVLEGEGDGSCNAFGNVNRAAFAQMVVNAAVLSSDGTMASDYFDDVTAGAWFDEPMGTAYAYGVMHGYENGDMGPGDWVTRGQAAYMTYAAQNPVYDPPVTGDDDDDDDDVTTGGGSLEVILGSDSHEDYTYFAAGTNAEVASFEVTASDEDVLVTSFTVELASGDSDSIESLALYNEAGTRISKVDTAIDSDDLSRMAMLEGGYTVAAGTSELFRLMNTFETVVDADGDSDGNVANTSTLYSYAFDSSMLESDADTVEVENDLTTGIFGLLDEDTGAVSFDDDGSISAVQVGVLDAEIASFEVTETSSDKDVWLYGVTLENTGTANLDDAITDLALYMNGDFVADGTQFGDYISFQMDGDTAPMIEAGTNESFEVQAKITGESLSTMIFTVEEALDVLATDEDGNNVAVTTSAYTGTSVTIEAGDVSVVGYDAASDKFRPDSTDVELGRFEVTAGTDNIELTTVNLDFNITDGTNTGTWNIADLFENFSVAMNGTNYSMDLNGAEGVAEEYTTDIDKVLVEGTVYEFVVTADTFSTTEADTNGGTLVDYTDFNLDMSLESLGNGLSTAGLVMEESVDGTAVTDVTPSTVSFRALDGETAGVALNVVSLSSAKSVVVGTENVLAMEFEVEEQSDISDLVFTQIAIEDTLLNFDNTEVSQVSLYQVNSDDTETLLDSVSGSQLADDAADFDNFDVTIAAGTAETFRVYVDFVDDDTNAGDTFKLAITTYDVEDDDNNEVYDALDNDATFGDFTAEGADQPASARTITLVASGILYIEMDNEDTTYGTESKRWLQMGEADQGLLALSLQADNESITLEDWKMVLSTTASTVLATDADAVAATALALPTTVAGQLKKTGAAGTGFVNGTDGAYLDIDNGGTVTTGDIRLVAGGTVAKGYGFANGTTVAATDGDAVAATALALQTTVASSLRKTAAAGTAFVNGTDAAYVDVDNDGTVTTGDVRLVVGSTVATGLGNENEISDIFQSFSVYDEDGVLLGTKTVSNEVNVLTFNSATTELNANIDAASTYYVTGELNAYGENNVGGLDGSTSATKTWTVTAVEAVGDSSNFALDEDGTAAGGVTAGEVGYGSTTTSDRAADDDSPFTTASETFGWVASNIVEVELLSSAENFSLPSTLSGGETNVAILAVTVDSTANLEDNGDELFASLTTLVFQFTKNTEGATGLLVAATTIERIDGSNAAVTGTVTSGAITNASGSVSFDMTGATTDNKIAPGTTAYFLVKSTLTKSTVVSDSNDFLKFSMDDINSSSGATDNFTWKDSVDSSSKVAVYMGNENELDGVQISE